jgi:death-on-curing protein
VTFDGKFLLADLFDMSAEYLFHLVQNHPFVDGNKRVGAVAAIVFLLTNDQDIGIGDDELELLTMNVAQGKLERGAVAAVLRSHAI